MLQIAELSRTKEVLKEKAVRALADAGVSHDAEGDKSDLSIQQESLRS